MLTPKQKQLLDFISDHIEATGIGPSFSEMQAALDIKSRGLVHRYLSCLVERGFIRRIPAKARAIEVLRKPGEPTRAVFEAAFIAAARDYLSPGEFAFIEAMARSSSGIAADIVQIADARHDHGQRLEVL